jgi:hypothetical protein
VQVIRKIINLQGDEDLEKLRTKARPTKDWTYYKVKNFGNPKESCPNGGRPL